MEADLLTENSKDLDVSDEEWLDIEDDEIMEINDAHCLFCEETFSSATSTFKHIKDIHHVDIRRFCKEKKLDFYSYVRMINYIRKHKLDSMEVSKVDLSCFDDEKYLKPVWEDDLLLQIDLDEMLMCSDDTGVPSEELEIAQVKDAEERALRAEEALSRAIEDLNSCKAEVKRLLFQNADKNSDSSAKPDMSEHTAYFESYAHYGIHEEMLKDNVRTEAYKQFIASNKDLFKDKYVLDIGCGTGILSMFAARAGAKLVIAVDQSYIVYQAMDIIRENGFSDVIKVVKGDAEQLVLPNNLQKVDIIISEWMGYFLFFEGMLDTLINCRDKYLSNDGIVYPDSCSISMAMMSDEVMWDSKISFWDEVHGFKMSCMKKYVIREALIEIVSEKNIISNPSEVTKFDLMKAKIKDLDFETEFELKITKSGSCTGMVGYFNIGFEKGVIQQVCFDTSYRSLPTHWKQTIFLFERKLHVEEGEILHCAIHCQKDPKDFRSLQIKLFVEKEDKSEFIKQFFVIN